MFCSKLTSVYIFSLLLLIIYVHNSAAAPAGSDSEIEDVRAKIRDASVDFGKRDCWTPSISDLATDVEWLIAQADNPGNDQTKKKRQSGVLSYLCQAGANANPAATSGYVDYPITAVDAAAQECLNRVLSGEVVRTNGNRGIPYPHRFRNDRGDNIPLLTNRCGSIIGDPNNYMYEFPILPSGNLYNGGGPGADRVVIKYFPSGCGDDEDGDWATCGLITHRGQENNGFIDCIPQS